MAHYSDSLAVYLPFERGFKDQKVSLKIHKLTLGETLEYMTVKSCRVLQGKLGLPVLELKRQSASLFCRKVLENIPEGWIEEIIELGENLNFPPTEEGKKTKKNLKNPAWVQELIARLGRGCGFTKEQVLDLYPAEIPALLKGIRRMEIESSVQTALAVNSPKTVSEQLKAIQPDEERGEISDEKYRELEAKYLKRSK